MMFNRLYRLFPKRPSRERGFTLIELLVVVSIIAVLASLILASLTSAQQGARDSRRKSDANQYQKALQQYAGANANTYPASTSAYAITKSGGAGCTTPLNSLTPSYLSQCLIETKSGWTSYIYQTQAVGGSANSDFRVCVTLERAGSTTDTFILGPASNRISGSCNVWPG